MPFIIVALIILVPLLALAFGVIDTARANARTGAAPIELTYRAYSA